MDELTRCDRHHRVHYGPTCGECDACNGYDPMASVEFARKVMYSSERPGFTELEKHIQAARKAK